jgi:hypothetical protein
MSSNPVSFRFPFQSQIASMPPEHQQVIKTVWNAITDLQGAIPSLKSQITANKTAVAAATAAVNTSTASETIVSIASTAGFLNNQSGNTTYTTVPSDAGAYILFSDASPVAVTLSTLGSGGGIVLPFYCTIFNEGVGLVTVTPADGTISFPNNLAAGSMPVSQGQAAVIIYDGSVFYAVIVCVEPQNTPQIASEWLNSFNSATGVFGQSQPVIADVAGLVAALALLAPIASPTFTGTVTQPTPSVLTAATTATSATAGAATALPATPAGYLEMSINGTVFKVPYFDV